MPTGDAHLRQPRGKLNPSELSRLILPYTGVFDSRVIIGPRIGEDAAIIQNNGNVLVVHSDPITGAVKDAGKLAVHVSVNDVVSKGADPRWISMVMLLPPRITASRIRQIAMQSHQAALEVSAAIVGGHTEISPNLKSPILVSTVIGEAERGTFLTSGGARPGDRIVMTKSAGMEGTAILARELPRLRRTVGSSVMKNASRMLDRISVYPEARIARRISGVTAMHDITEGGVLCAVQEVAVASGCGCVVQSAQIPVSEETRAICEALKLDPLRLIGSGSLILTVQRADLGLLLSALEDAGISAEEIGEITKGGFWMVSAGRRQKIADFVREELWKVFGSSGS